jgi:flagellar biosynthesis protein FlhB
MAEKTEAPTPRRRDEARAKGQGVGRSAELNMGLTLGVGTLALAALLPGIARTLVEQMHAAIVGLDPHASSATLMAQTGGALITTLTLILPLAGLVMIAGVGGNLISGGLVVSYRAVRFDPSRINPMAGFKRMADRQAMIRLGLSVAKLAILAVISWQVVGGRIPGIVTTSGASIGTIAGSCLSAVFQLGLTITILLAVVALVDFVVQRRRASESIKMTKEEVKQEYRESEGDPQVRGARRRRARQIAFGRMMDAVPTADVVVTNPTTLAVAIKYDSLSMRAPKIVAKGQRLMAERIKTLAREHGVPVIEDKPLARALFSRPVGAEVPTHLYRAVARLLVLVHQARFTGSGRGSGRGADARTARGRAVAPARTWWNGRPTAASGRAPFAATPIPVAVAATEAARSYAGAGGETAGVSVVALRAEVIAPVDALAVAEEIEADLLDEPLLDASEVDEEALAAAMAEDEFRDVTPEELARLEAQRAEIPPVSGDVETTDRTADGLGLGVDVTIEDDEEQPR